MGDDFMKGKRMARLRIKETAEAIGLNMSQLQVKSGLSMGVIRRLGVIRRYWYNTANGLAGGDPLEMISLEHIHAIADVLQVHPGQLFASADEVAA